MQRLPPPRVEMRHVLSGGHLKRPCVVQTVVVSDLVFIELSVKDSAITRFLTGKPHQRTRLQDLQVLASLMHLRNEATRKKICLAEEGEVDDLGLDAPKTTAPRRSFLADTGRTIVEVDYEGTKLKVLGDLGARRVWMELSSQTMKFLFDQVSAEVGQEASAASEAIARGSGSDASGCSEGQDSTTQCSPAKRSKGITWISSRNTWLVRYKDSSGSCHSKRFRPSSHAGDDN